MLKKLWISLPVTLLCAFSHANTISVATPAPSNTLAAPAAATSTTEAPKAEEAPKVKFSMGIGPGYTMSAQAKPDGTRDESVATTFTPSIGYGNYSVMLFELYNQDLKDTSSGGSFIDPILFFSRKSIPMGDYFSIAPGLNLTLPMTQASKDNGLYYNIGASSSFILNTKTLGMDAWKISYYLGYNRNITQYNTSPAGEPLTMQRIRQRINVGYAFTEKFSLATRFEFDANFSADGIVRNKFMHYQTFSYDVADNVSLSIGHTNSNTLLDGKTYQSNLKFYDEEKSEYSIGLDISL